MKKYDRITPDGTKDYILGECKLLRSAGDALRELYEKYGYSEAITPTIEFYDVFSEGVGRVSQNELYTLTDNAGRLLTMRPDSTKPIARMYAAHLQKSALPLRFFYDQPVFKRNISFSKKSDETMQMGVELIGLLGEKCDLEVLMLALYSMQTLLGADFLIEIGHTGFIQSVLFGLDESVRKSVRHALAAKNYPELYRISAQLGDAGKKINLLPELFGDGDVLKEAEELFPDCAAPLCELKNTLEVLSQNGFKENVLIDLAVAGDFDYYTGIVFKGFAKNDRRELMSGGRYDSLYGDYDLEVPAIGFAVNLDEAVRLLAKKRGSKSKEQILVLYANSADIFKLSPLVEQFSEQGFKCRISLFGGIDDTVLWAKKIGAAKVIELTESGQTREIDTNA
jgi:ATP phosphoribosyltransferase regulatory subunit